MEETEKTLKEIELDIFRQFIKICEENKLKYFVIGGTALGAVRHKGYIPWDDDIDVALPREDYEKFLLIAPKALPYNMFLQTYITDTDYPHPFAKIRRSDTTFIEKSLSKININHGVYIDIFPLDGYPQSNLSNKLFKTKERILKQSIYNIFLIDRTGKKSLKTELKKLVIKLLPDYKAAVKKLDNLYKSNSYKNSTIVANFCGAWGIKEVMPKEFFGNGTEGEFEGIKVTLPEKTHEYLTSLYGDYMKLPPEEKRIGHHYCTIIDLEKSYKEYIR